MTGWRKGEDSLDIWRFLLGCRDFVGRGLAVMGCHSEVVPGGLPARLVLCAFFQSLFGKHGGRGNRSIL